MLKKFFSQASLSLINSGMSFLVTYVLIKTISISIVGDIYVALSLCSLILLIQVIIPPNFACVRIQDKKGMSSLVISYYIYIQILVISLSIFFAKFILNFNFSLIVFFVLYCCALGITNLCDVLLQAKARLDIFFYNQLTLSTIKLLVLYFFGKNTWGLGEIFVVFSVAQVLVVVLMFIFTLRLYDYTFKMFPLNKVVRYVRKSYAITKGYYLTAITKRLFDNAPALIVAPYVSKEVLGTFSLYQKCLIFGSSFLRTLESLLMHRLSSTNVPKNLLLIVTPICQVMVFSFGYVYFFFTIGVDFKYLFLFSFLIYPMAVITVLRAEQLKTFNTVSLNYAMLSSFACFALYGFFMNTNTLLFVLESYSLLIISYAFFLKVFSKRFNQ
jgi:hypothetical protein